MATRVPRGSKRQAQPRGTQPQPKQVPPTRFPPHIDRFPRDSILKAVQEHPGIGVRELVRLTGHTSMTVGKHVDLLRQAGDVVAVQDGRKHRHYLPADVQPVTPQLSDGAHQLLAALQKSGPTTFPDLRRQFPATPRSTLRYRLNRLEKFGYIERDAFHAAHFSATRATASRPKPGR